jgi:hypothetical protein
MAINEKRSDKRALHADASTAMKMFLGFGIWDEC